MTSAKPVAPLTQLAKGIYIWQDSDNGNVGAVIGDDGFVAIPETQCLEKRVNRPFVRFDQALHEGDIAFADLALGELRAQRRLGRFIAGKNQQAAGDLIEAVHIERIVVVRLQATGEVVLIFR